MEENKNIQQPGPIDIPDAAQPTRTDSAAKPRPAAAKPKAAAKPGAAAKPRPAGTAPAKKGAKKAVKRKPAPAAQEDDLPVWLQKLVDWVADLPEKLKRLPGKLKKLPGKFRKLWGSWFYRVYFPLVALALIAMIVGWRWLDGFAADYDVLMRTAELLREHVPSVQSIGGYARIDNFYDKTEEQLLKKLESELGRTTEPCALAPHPPRRPEDNPRQGARLSVRHR